MAEYMEGATTVNVTRLHKATPPLQGTFDVEIFGGQAKGSYNRNTFYCNDFYSFWNDAHYFTWKISINSSLKSIFAAVEL